MLPHCFIWVDGVTPNGLRAGRQDGSRANHSDWLGLYQAELEQISGLGTEAKLPPHLKCLKPNGPRLLRTPELSLRMCSVVQGSYLVLPAS